MSPQSELLNLAHRHIVDSSSKEDKLIRCKPFLLYTCVNFAYSNCKSSVATRSEWGEVFTNKLTAHKTFIREYLGEKLLWTSVYIWDSCYGRNIKTVLFSDSPCTSGCFSATNQRPPFCTAWQREWPGTIGMFCCTCDIENTNSETVSKLIWLVESVQVNKTCPSWAALLLCWLWFVSK